MKKYFHVKTYTTQTDAALFILRLLCGIAFIMHGWGKIQTPFSWMPGGAVPGIFQALAAVSEFGGGIALIIGLVTPLASLGLVFTMIVAAIFHMSMGHPFVGLDGGPSYELAGIYFGIFLFILFAGPGRFSLDSKVFGKS